MGNKTLELKLHIVRRLSIKRIAFKRKLLINCRRIWKSEVGDILIYLHMFESSLCGGFMYEIWSLKYL